jgi:hypothetical protein
MDFTVKADGVDIRGRGVSTKGFSEIRKKIAKFHVNKAINYPVIIAPAMLNTFIPVKLQADSLLSQYLRMTARTN